MRLNFEQKMQAYISTIEQALHDYLPQKGDGQEAVFEAMAYSLSSGGKRIRPVLTLEFATLCGMNPEDALPFACAVEMIHTYSLIHDDLPCMDNDDMRRGQPACHIQYGEDTALLAGDGLLTLAFETMLQKTNYKKVGIKNAANAMSILAHNAGVHGMIGGQVIDLQSEGRNVGIETLRTMDRMKTGALIDAACRMGCAAAGASREKLEAAGTYAAAIGLAFQIVDDILDVTGDAALLGKPIGSDAENQKSTYVTLLGLDPCRQAVERLTDNAIKSLRHFEENTAFLETLAQTLASRKH